MINIEDDYIVKIYNKYDLNVVSSVDGLYLQNINGEKYLDFISGVGVNILGYNNPIINNAIQQQLQKGFIHQSNIFYNSIQNLIAYKLFNLINQNNGNKKFETFFCNSGVEACEFAIKVVRKYAHSKYEIQNPEIICFTNSFHGRSIATLSASGRKEYLSGFEPNLEGFKQAIFNDIQDLHSKVNSNTIAIMIEPIQGESGINIATEELMQEIQKICNTGNILFIVDEVQSGCGRTGKFFAYQNYANIQPNVITLAKGFGGGIPTGCCILDEKISKYMLYGSHGCTCGGNALSMNVANAIIDEISKTEMLDHILYIGNILQTKLKELQIKYSDFIKDIRGIGLMLGMELHSNINNRKFAEFIIKNKLLVSTGHNNVIRFLPPYIIKEQHVNEAIDILDNSIVQWQMFNK